MSQNFSTERSVVGFDLETSSTIDLTTQGSYRYSEDVSTRALMFAWHLIGTQEQPRLWCEGDPLPEEFCEYVRRGYLFSGWNVQSFDRLGYRYLLVDRFGFPPIPDDDWIDTMHRAASTNLPRSLDGCAKFIGVKFDEDKKDKARIKRITNAHVTPIPALVSHILNGAVPDIASRRTAPALTLWDDMAWLAARCVQDVAMETEVFLALPPWPQVEPWRFMPHIDRRINDRGILLDMPLVQGLAQAASIEAATLNIRMNAATGGRVKAATQVEELKRFLIDRGVELPSNLDPKEDEEDAVEQPEEVSRKSPWKLRKNDIADIIAREDVPEDCRLAVGIRAEASKASARKFNSMQLRASLDWRLRGAMNLGGAQQTMRWASTGANLYNTVRDVFANLDEISEANGLDKKKNRETALLIQNQALLTGIKVGRMGDPDVIRSLYEAPRRDAQGRMQMAGVMTWISRMTRRTLAARAGNILINGDFAQIEARVTVWLAGQHDMLRAFANREDVYTIAAAGIYGVPPEAVTKEMRQVGKVTILACVGEGSLVLTDKGLVRIEQVSVDSKVWDGIEWVSHEGPVFRGWRETIIYDGLEATIDHQVYVDGATRQMAFGDTAARKIPLTQTGFGRKAIRIDGNNSAGCGLRHQFALICRNTLHAMRLRTMDVLLQPHQRKKQRLSNLQQTSSSSYNVGSGADCGETTLHQSKRSGVLKLRWSRYSVSVCVGDRSWIVGNRKSRTSTWQAGDRSKKQQRTLRTGQFAVGYTTTAGAEYASCTDYDVSGRLDTKRTCAARGTSAYARHKIRGPNFATVSTGKQIRRGDVGADKERPFLVQAYRPVWDILNAGPRNRFTVSDKLVHNCGFGGGINALITMGYNYGLLMSIAEATPVVKAYRETNAAVRAYWYATDDAAAKAVMFPGHEFPVAPMGAVSYFMDPLGRDCLCCRLPSGRWLRYWAPRLTQEYWDKEKTQPKDRLSLSGLTTKGRVTFRRSLYHTILVENQVQGIATADMLGHALDNMDRNNLPIVLHVYDSGAAEVDEDKADLVLPMFRQCMLDQPAWTLGLPVDIDVEVSTRFA